jgi:hypothetical protein
LVETGRHILFHGTEPGAALALLFCAGAVVRFMQSLGVLGPASETAEELLFVLSLALFCDEKSLSTNIAQSQSMSLPHTISGDLSWMNCLLSANANFQLHCSLSKFDSKKMLNLFIGEFSKVKKAGHLAAVGAIYTQHTRKHAETLQLTGSRHRHVVRVFALGVRSMRRR